MYIAIEQLLIQPRLKVREPDIDISALFQEALRDPSNLELDWLWLATMVTRSSEQAYCLKQALRISPRSSLAKRGLARVKAAARRAARSEGTVTNTTDTKMGL